MTSQLLGDRWNKGARSRRLIPVFGIKMQLVGCFLRSWKYEERIAGNLLPALE
ncbi:hypothetical protein ACQ4M3_17110 [Leptolyngbya sp. AN03gr2]|uniref:hypothetical protein n=1 Tax=Leptolyngbya sp. AN10 TaxID=3423365 RepID=UPI003D3199FB